MSIETRSSSHNEAARFEEKVRIFLSLRWGVKLIKRKISIAQLGKEFDCVSEDGNCIGDVKFLAMPSGGNRQTSLDVTFDGINSYVWLLQKTGAAHKFMIFGNDRELPKKYIQEYGSLLEDVNFYFLDGERLEVLYGKEPREQRVVLARSAFGMWRNQEDMDDAMEYVERLRSGWQERLKEVGHGG